MYKVEIWSDNEDFYLTDQAFKMFRWAKDFCPSIIEYEHVDMSDIDSWSGADDGWFYYFNDEQDALLFALKFQGNQQLI